MNKIYVTLLVRCRDLRRTEDCDGGMCRRCMVEPTFLANILVVIRLTQKTGKTAAVTHVLPMEEKAGAMRYKLFVP